MLTETATRERQGQTAGMDLAGAQTRSGALIINADDWGRDKFTTDRILECFSARALSSVSAMVFMEDSERAASIAFERGIDIGVHLNLTEAFSGRNVPVHLQQHHLRVAQFLLRHRFSQIVYHPGLATSFEYVTKAQLEEFHRIYGASPRRIDGHHHMHLSENMLSGKLLPVGTLVRKNFSFEAEEKSWANHRYRRFVDGRLRRRHQLVDFLFSLIPIQTERLERIFSYAQCALVELETHPVNSDEFKFLTSPEISRLLHGVAIAPNFTVAFMRNPTVAGSATL
jgi:chitin disaccharide deacetylase